MSNKSRRSLSASGEDIAAGVTKGPRRRLSVEERAKREDQKARDKWLKNYIKSRNEPTSVSRTAPSTSGTGTPIDRSSSSSARPTTSHSQMAASVRGSVSPSADKFPTWDGVPRTSIETAPSHVAEPPMATVSRVVADRAVFSWLFFRALEHMVMRADNREPDDYFAKETLIEDACSENLQSLGVPRLDDASARAGFTRWRKRGFIKTKIADWDLYALGKKGLTFFKRAIQLGGYPEGRMSELFPRQRLVATSPEQKESPAVTAEEMAEKARKRAELAESAWKLYEEEGSSPRQPDLDLDAKGGITNRGTPLFFRPDGKRRRLTPTSGPGRILLALLLTGEPPAKFRSQDVSYLRKVLGEGVLMGSKREFTLEMSFTLSDQLAKRAPGVLRIPRDHRHP